MIAEQTLDHAQALKSLLEYYRACGVDCAVEETPRDRFADSARVAAKAPTRRGAAAAEPKARPEKARAAASIFPRRRFARPKARVVSENVGGIARGAGGF